jgi:hypothetical protein
MMATQTLREYALDLLERCDDVVPLHKHNRLEGLPKVEWWDLSRPCDGSEVLEIRVGRRYYYIYYWTRYLIDGWNPDRCVRIHKDSAVGKRITEMLHDA